MKEHYYLLIWFFGLKSDQQSDDLVMEESFFSEKRSLSPRGYLASPFQRHPGESGEHVVWGFGFWIRKYFIVHRNCLE
jgi:hypothetical protein